MSTPRQLACPILLALMLSGCGSDTPFGVDVRIPPRDAAPVQTDALSYTLVRRQGEYRAHVTATLTNTTTEPLHFARCMPGSTTPMYGLRRTGPDSTRTLFSDWAWACVGGVPTGRLLPGQSVSVRVPLGSVDQPNMSPPLRPEHLIGRMRVSVALCAAAVSDSDYCVPLPLAQRESNAFVVTY